MVSCFSYTTVRVYTQDIAETLESFDTYARDTSEELNEYHTCQVDREAKLPELKSVFVWRSKKRMPPESITLVTQLSLERLSMMRSQCKIWGDRISAAIYLPYVKKFGAASSEVRAVNGSTIEEVIAFLDAFHNAMERESENCALDLELVVERFLSWDDPNIGLYPFNAVRNRALMLANTETIMLLDVDFVPSALLPKLYHGKQSKYKELLQTLVVEKIAYIVPAFETRKQGTDGRVLAKSLAEGNKIDAAEAFRRGDIEGFQVSKYPAGHSPTDFDRWMNASDPYFVAYEKGFEPYILVARQYVPWYDERFRGYGMDKIVHLAHLASQLRVKMSVHESGFVVHCPHQKSTTFKNTKQSGQWDALTKLYVQVRRDISIHEFYPVTSFAEHCPMHISSDKVNKARKKKLKALKRQKRLAGRKNLISSKQTKKT